MKKTLITLMVVIIFSFIPRETDYCKGWKQGHCEGWRDVKGVLAVCPVTPICPISEVNKNREIDGFIRGFKAGKKQAQEQ